MKGKMKKINHGGSRKGAGRPRIHEGKKEAIWLYLLPQEREAIMDLTPQQRKEALLAAARKLV
jgi:hypothetical protein